MDEKIFSLEHQFNFFCDTFNIHDAEMKKFAKLAFFGGCAKILTIMRDDITQLPDAVGIIALENMSAEASKTIIDEWGG